MDGLDGLRVDLAVLGRGSRTVGAAVVGRGGALLPTEDGGQAIPTPACKPGKEREKERKGREGDKEEQRE